MVWVWLAGAAVLLSGAVLPLWRLRSTKRSREGAAARIRADASRLEHGLATLPAGGDPVAERLVEEARERWLTTGALLARARGPQEYEVAARTVEEGLRLLAEASARLPDPVGEPRDDPRATGAEP